MIGSVLATLDFEASSLAMESYPIEVGIAVGPRDGGDPDSWSSLIRPTATWVSEGEWDLDAQAVHGISKEQLGGGLSPRRVMEELNARLPEGSVVLCDGGAYDPMWLRKLAAAARIQAAFQLWDLRAAFVLDRRRLDRCTAALAGDRAEHRAGGDSLRLWRAVQAAMR